MASDKALYWVAAAVLAVGVSHQHGFVSSSRDWTQQIADRSVSVVDMASGQAMRMAGMGQAIFGRK
jgi:hypothetical protein